MATMPGMYSTKPTLLSFSLLMSTASSQKHQPAPNRDPASPAPCARICRLARCFGRWSGLGPGRGGHAQLVQLVLSRLHDWVPTH